jgi:DNA-binding transcriptional regulator YhcF (GntR family)
MTNDELTRWIRWYQGKFGYPPTIREMADEYGVNEKTVRNRLRSLREEGEVTWTQGGHRTVRVNRHTGKARSIPM